MSNLRILVVGGGGREHAICWKLAQSPNVSHIFCAPGNGGTAKEKKTANVDIGVMDFPALAKFAEENRVDFVVVGPDDPIAAGAVDYFEKHGNKAFGPRKKLAQLESSKVFAKEFMVAHKIPTARYMVCDNLQDALNVVHEHPWARIVKADGLALGKGVFVCNNADEAADALHVIFREGRFGEAGRRVVIEERLSGDELSLLMFVDGKRLVTMPASQDHKRRFDGDRGPNTGGMGAFAPVELYRRCAEEIEEQVLQPLRKALDSREFDYHGILFAGLMVECKPTEEAGRKAYQPYVLEFNARFGDPETQALMPLLESDLAEIFLACIDGKLGQTDIRWSSKSSCCVVAAANSYPESGSKGESIDIGTLPPDTFVFHAGTRLEKDQLKTNGGRVLAVTGLGASIEAACNSSYNAIKQVKFKGMDYRKDIARRSAPACLSP